jgi:hypothetical protein
VTSGFFVEVSGRLVMAPERRVASDGRPCVVSTLLSTEGVDGDYVSVWLVAFDQVAEQLEALSSGCALSVAGGSEVVMGVHGFRDAGLCVTVQSLLPLG